MNYIEILITNHEQSTNIFIDTKNNKITINTKEKDISQENIYNLLRIIRNWQKTYFNSKIIDGESFVIKISTDDGIDIIEGRGDYPSNYSSLKDWIGEVYE